MCVFVAKVFVLMCITADMFHCTVLLLGSLEESLVFPPP